MWLSRNSISHYPEWDSHRRQPIRNCPSKANKLAFDQSMLVIQRAQHDTSVCGDVDEWPIATRKGAMGKEKTCIQFASNPGANPSREGHRKSGCINDLRWRGYPVPRPHSASTSSVLQGELYLRWHCSYPAAFNSGFR